MADWHSRLPWLRTTKMEMFQLGSWWNPQLAQKLVTAGLGVALILVAARLLRRSIRRYIQDSGTRYRSQKFITFVAYLLVAVTLLNSFSDRLTGLTVFVGAAAAGIAFALQEVVVSVAGWVAVSFGGFYTTGDRVEIGGIRGDVIDIGMLRTTLMELGGWVQGDLYNGRIVRVANSFIFKDPVVNYSADFPFVWEDVRVPIHSSSDWRLARKLLEQVTEEVVGDYARGAQEAWDTVVRKYRIENASVRPMITMGADENWFTFRVRYTVDYKRRRLTLDRWFERMLEEMEKTNGQVRLASAAYEITAFPPVEVRRSPGTESVS